MLCVFTAFTFIHFWLCWVFVAARKISLVATSRDYSPVVMRGLLIVLASLVSEFGLYLYGLQ